MDNTLPNQNKDMATRIEYRCTRSAIYLPGSPGYLSEEARQGYYIVATSRVDALATMAKRFPDDAEIAALQGREAFTAISWQTVVR